MLIPSENGSIRHKSWGLAAPTWKRGIWTSLFFPFFFFSQPNRLGWKWGRRAGQSVYVNQMVFTRFLCHPPTPPSTPYTTPPLIQHLSLAAWSSGRLQSFLQEARRVCAPDALHWRPAGLPAGDPAAGRQTVEKSPSSPTINPPFLRAPRRSCVLRVSMRRVMKLELSDFHLCDVIDLSVMLLLSRPIILLHSQEINMFPKILKTVYSE